jgi:hypothetical protein
MWFYKPYMAGVSHRPVWAPGLILFRQNSLIEIRRSASLSCMLKVKSVYEPIQADDGLRILAISNLFLPQEVLKTKEFLVVSKSSLNKSLY